MVGYEYASEVRPGLSHSELRFPEKIPRDSAWTSNPPFYPVFAEFDEPGKDVMIGTGTLLRALLPFATAEARQSISSYSGNTLIVLKSQFETSTAPGAVLLVTIEDFGGRDTGDWLHLPTKNLSLSICYAPWDAAILYVNLISDANRTEPMLEYGRSMGRYKTSAVV